MAEESATQTAEAPIVAEGPSVLESPLLRNSGFSHGFFTRKGGVSTGPFESLNFTRTTGDQPTNVDRNIAIVADSLGVPREHIYFPLQTHGTVSVVVDGSENRADIEAVEADITITRAHVAAAIRTADCVPVLVACVETGWVAACHAGWKGCVRGVVPETIARLRTLGATRLIASIGPHISVDSFEVSPETAQEIISASPDPDIFVLRDGRSYIDLRKMVRAQLQAAGFAPEAIDDVFGCTVLDRELFYSFRRDGDRSGRMLSAIVGGVPQGAPGA